MPATRKSRRAPRLEIEITNHIIARSKRRSLKCCMISAAIKAQVPWASNVRTDVQQIRISDIDRDERLIYPTPALGAIKLLQFDNGQPIKPFHLRLQRGQVKTAPSVAMRKWRATQKTKPATAKKTATGKKAPKLYADDEREFGLRKMTRVGR